MFQRTTATEKLLKLDKRIRAVAGGSSASKTISILMILIDYCLTVNNEVGSVVSESFPHLKRGAIRDFLNIMESHGYYKDDCWNRTDYIYTFPTTNTKLEFFSADQPSKVRGPRRDFLFLNEANNIPYETFTQLEIRTNKYIWMDWNPVCEFWFYTELLNKYPDLDFVTLTYKDNEALNPAIIQAIESRRSNTQWFKVYGLGELGEVEGRIFKDWQIIDEIPHEARLERYGLDFGYRDPTALIGIYYYNGGFIFDECLYQCELTNKQIADVINNIPKALVVGDSADPKSIEELKTYGVNILPAQKGPDSIRQGIQYIQDKRCSITKRSVNLIKEYRNYMWARDKDGEYIKPPKPIDMFNHGMDAIRYGMETLKPKKDLPKNYQPFVPTFNLSG
jgi:phage terminase large subunit